MQIRLLTRGQKEKELVPERRKGLPVRGNYRSKEAQKLKGNMGVSSGEGGRGWWKGPF